MNSPDSKEPSSWLLWHPHQGFWNRRLIHTLRRLIPIRPIYLVFHGIVNLIDTAILFARVVGRRISRTSPAKLFSSARLSDDQSLLYLDIGTHREGKELRWVAKNILPDAAKNYEAIGFEASLESFNCVKENLKELDHVSLQQMALCRTPPENGLIRLYSDHREGIADSLYRETDTYEDVEARRLSDLLRDRDLPSPDTIIILRMNIEGAEADVIKDLVDAKLSKDIAGYYGTWDDVSKVEEDHGAQFRAYIKENGISPITFNGRDMRWPLRRWCIRYDIHTHLLRALSA